MLSASCPRPHQMPSHFAKKFGSPERLRCSHHRLAPPLPLESFGPAQPD